MGRHRRTASTGAAADRAAATADPNDSWEYDPGHGGESPQADPSDTVDVPPGRSPRGAHRHRRRRPGHVRTGLLGASAAVAVGAIAVTSGVLPGGGSYSIGGDEGSDQVRSVDTPSGLETLGGAGDPTGGATTTRPDADRSTETASKKPSASRASGSRSASDTPGQSAQPERRTPRTTAPAEPPTPTRSQSTVPVSPSRTEPSSTSTPTTRPTQTAEHAAARQVLALVNEERNKAGCSPLRSDRALAELASAFSEQMADEDFFDHTDPAGLSPWDRAAKAGITHLGGENIARGQADAAAVMDSWMNSAGHRANILNCDYRTIGIGVHFGAGGPWWTQDFGF